jgi:ABC-type sugar transport system permease subunit
VKEAAFALALLAPSIALFSTFAFYPLVKTFYLGFFRSDPFGLSSSYVGFDQYMTCSLGKFHRSLRTRLFALFTVPTASCWPACLLAHQKLRHPHYRVFESTAATRRRRSVMWLTLLNPSIGVINYGLKDLK